MTAKQMTATQINRLMTLQRNVTNARAGTAGLNAVEKLNNYVGWLLDRGVSAEDINETLGH